MPSPIEEAVTRYTGQAVEKDAFQSRCDAFVDGWGACKADVERRVWYRIKRLENLRTTSTCHQMADTYTAMIAMLEELVNTL